MSNRHDPNADHILETCRSQGRNAWRTDRGATRPVGAIPPGSCTTDLQRCAWLDGYQQAMRASGKEGAPC